MAKPKQINQAKSIIERILSQPIPDEGHLKHPLVSKKRTPSQTTMEGMLSSMKKKNAFPENILEWTTRTFVDYFASRVQEETGGNYKKLYRADIVYIQQILKFFSSNGLEKNEWARSFIEWALIRREQLKRRDGYFTISILPRYLNQYLQEEVLPQVERGSITRKTFDTSLLEEIKQAEAEGKATEIISRFGIPVATTYFVSIKGFGKDRLVAAFKERFVAMQKTGAEGNAQMIRIFQSSVIGSPYPEGFLLTDWREVFGSFLEPFTNDPWYRPDDYKGQPLEKYDAILGNKQNSDAVQSEGEV